MEEIHRFRAANCSKSHGTVERINRGVVKTFRVVFIERRRPPSEWPWALDSVQWDNEVGVPGAHGGNTVGDDVGATFSDDNVGACRGRR